MVDCDPSQDPTGHGPISGEQADPSKNLEGHDASERAYSSPRTKGATELCLRKETQDEDRYENEEQAQNFDGNRTVPPTASVRPGPQRCATLAPPV